MGKFLGTYMQTCIIKILGNNFQQQLQHPITKKADAEPKKSRSNKKSRCRTSLLKNGPTKLPGLLIILASWVEFFDIGLLLYPVPHHTLQCCTRKSFWVTRTGESKLFCIGFSLFWSRCRTWCSFTKKIFFDHRKFLWRLLETLHDIHGFSCLGAVKKAIKIHQKCIFQPLHNGVKSVLGIKESYSMGKMS